MTHILSRATGRRAFIGGTVAGAAMLATGCATTGYGYSFDEAIRRLLLLSSERAFARLTAPGGYWDQQVATLDFGDVFGARGNVLAAILTSGLFKSRLVDAFADVAIRGAERAAPIVADAVRVVGFAAAEALVRGGPTAATAFLRNELDGTLVEAMVPELGQAIRVARDPVISDAIARLSGIDVTGVATRFSATVNDAIWTEMGIEETAIRRDPRATRDPLLIGVFGLARAL
jgi:hypothetical protein